MKFIKNVETLEDLKQAYKKLALKYHPDCGGTDEEMAQINNEYDELFEKLKNTHKNKDGEFYQKESIAASIAGSFITAISGFVLFKRKKGIN